MPGQNEQDNGKKVIFVHPHSVIREGLISVIVKYEFEVYLLDDHQQAAKAAKFFPDSIIFINLDDGLSEPQWEEYIRGLMDSEETAGLKIGILSYNEDANLAQKYLMDIMVPCGFIKLKLGLVESTKILLKTLEVNEAKGRRKYVRATCGDSSKATFNIKLKTGIHSGQVIDISAAGMACTFDDDVALKVGTVIDDIQLRLKGTLCRAGGKLAGINQGEINRYVIMFGSEVDDANLQKIHSFVHSALQESLTKTLSKG